MPAPGRRPPPPVLLVLTLAMLALAGCVCHEARVAPPAPPTGAAAAPVAGIVIGSKIQPGPPTEQVFTDPQPLDLPVSAWRREEDGRLCRYEGRACTPLPWWQRFPADAACDFWPATAVASATTTVVLVPVTATDPQMLAAEARNAGYARPLPDQRHVPKESTP